MSAELEIRRNEALIIFSVTNDGTEERLSFESEDEENLTINVENKRVAFVDMKNFLKMCERAIELWGEST